SKAALDTETLTRLFYYGVTVETIYEGHPQDMEYVVKAKKIRPVQTRPVDRPPPHPTYLDVRKAPEAVQEIFHGESDLSGTAEALTIRSRGEVLILDDVAQAFERDKEYTFKSGLHRVVVVKNRVEEMNSHAIVNLSGMGIPVIYCDDMSKLEGMLKKV